MFGTETAPPGLLPGVPWSEFEPSGLLTDLLSSLDVDGLDADDALETAAAWERLVAHAQAQQLRDHTIPHDQDGPTAPGNLGALCAITTGPRPTPAGHYPNPNPASSSVRIASSDIFRPSVEQQVPRQRLAVLLDALDVSVPPLAWLAGFEAHTVANIAAVRARQTP